MAEVVSGMGANAKRTDKNLSARLQKINNKAKIQNATGGAYGERAALTQIAQAAPTETPTPVVPPATEITPRSNRAIPQTVGAFAPTQRAYEDVSAGAATGDGPDASVLMTPVDAPDQTAVYARAMYALFPSPATRRIVEAFEEEGR